MIGLFLCWVAGSYWKKIYYIYITVQELIMILGLTLGASMGEDGDYDPVTGNETAMIILMLMFLIVMLILYAKDTKIADAFNMLIIMCISLGFFNLTHVVSKVHAIFVIIFLTAAVFMAIFVYWADSYSAVLPSSYFAVFTGMFWMFFIKGSDFVLVKEWKGGLLFWGFGILLTAVGCLVQLLILKKTEMGTKKRNKLSDVLK